MFSSGGFFSVFFCLGIVQQSACRWQRQLLQVVALNTRGCVPHGHVPMKGVGEEGVGLGADESVSVVFSRVKQKHSVMLLLLCVWPQPRRKCWGRRLTL